jgi:hypothetical protein
MMLIESRCHCCGLVRHDFGAAASELEGWTIASGRAYCGRRRCREAAEQARRERAVDRPGRRRGRRAA